MSRSACVGTLYQHMQVTLYYIEYALRICAHRKREDAMVKKLMMATTLAVFSRIWPLTPKHICCHLGSVDLYQLSWEDLMIRRSKLGT